MSPLAVDSVEHNGGDVLKMLKANEDGTMDMGELKAVLDLLAPGEWDGAKFEQLVASLGEANGRVNVGKLFGVEVDAVVESPLKIAVYSAVTYVRSFMQPLVDKFAGSFFIEEKCTKRTAHFCDGANAVCLFVNDNCNREILQIFKETGIQLVLLRCAGFDRVDVDAAAELGIRVVRVPAYSPYAVAEHAVSIVTTLNRRLHIARNRVRNGNYELSGLVGMDLNGKVCGVVGTGKIGQIVAKIFKGFGMKVICYDVFKNDYMTKELGCEYVDLDDLYSRADIVSLHVPLLPSTKYMINDEAIDKMKAGVMLVNVSRGGLVETEAVIKGLGTGKIKAYGTDVYENEAGLFFRDFDKMEDSKRLLKWDQQFSLLRSFPNVLITPHSAFLTQDALNNILGTTITNAEQYIAGSELTNEVKATGQSSEPAKPKLNRRMSVVSDEFTGFDLEANLQRDSMRSVMCSPVPEYEGEVNTSVKVAIFSVSEYVRGQMGALVARFPESKLIKAECTAQTARLCAGSEAVCLFVNDEAGKDVIEIFREEGVKLILLRCAGFDRVDLAATKEAGIKVARVPAYSPYAVAEHAVSLGLCLNRRLHRCYNRVAEGMFELSGLVGMDLQGKTCGIVGTGKIGQIAAKIFKGFGMEVICFDVFKNDVITKELGLQYVELDELYARSDVITLHVPLLKQTHHQICKESIDKMKRGVILINVSRGGLVNSTDLLAGISSGQIGGAGLDVYEREKDIFFKNFSEMDDMQRLKGLDPVFMRLQSFPNVIITPHTAFLTHEALKNICSTTIENLEEFISGKPLTNEVKE